MRNEPKNPRVVLQADHERINAILDRLLAALRADDRAAALSLWSGVEKGVLAHLDVEEMLVFPLLEESQAAEIESLRRQHDEIRSKLGKLGIDFQLQVVPVERVAAFLSLLRAHEEREESLLYPQAERRIPVNAARSIFAHLTAAIVGVLAVPFLALGCGLIEGGSGVGPDASIAIEPDGAAIDATVGDEIVFMDDAGDAMDAADAYDAPGLDAIAACPTLCAEAGVGTCDPSGTCTVSCVAAGTCTAAILCPSGIPCAVTCTGAGSCTSTIDCKGSTSCNVQCVGAGSCTNGIGCSGKTCEVDCIGIGSCTGGVCCDAGTCSGAHTACQ